MSTTDLYESYHRILKALFVNSITSRVWTSQTYHWNKVVFFKLLLLGSKCLRIIQLRIQETFQHVVTFTLYPKSDLWIKGKFIVISHFLSYSAVDWIWIGRKTDNRIWIMHTLFTFTTLSQCAFMFYLNFSVKLH